MKKYLLDTIKWHAAENGTYLEAPYKKDFVDEFKIFIPSRERVWNKVRKQWWVSDQYLDEVDNLLIEHFERKGSGRIY